MGNKIFKNVAVNDVTNDASTIDWNDPSKDIARKYLYLHPKPTSSRAERWNQESAKQKDWTNYVDAFNQGMAVGTVALGKTLIHPIDSLIGLGEMSWDGLNAISEATLGLTTEGSRERNLARGAAINKWEENLINGDGITRTKMLASLAPGMTLGVAIGAGAGAAVGFVGETAAEARSVAELSRNPSHGFFSPPNKTMPGGEGIGASRIIPKSTNTLGPIDSNILNQKYISEGYFPPYNARYRARNFLLNKDRGFVRVHGEDNQVSKWMMRAKEIEGLTPLEIKEKFALEFTPRYVSQVDVPANTMMRTSVAGPQMQWGASGGGIQYELLQRIPQSSYKYQLPIHQPLLEPNYFTEPYDGWRSMMLRR